jgi:peptidoglycan-associated lipoprotein
MFQMRSRIFIQTVLLVAVASFAVTGCGLTKKKPKTGTGGTGTDTSVPPIGDAGGIASAQRPMDTGDWQHGQFTPVYFDYDSAKVRPNEVSKIETVAAQLKSGTGKLVVEGHCDERGTAEYNRALGERRAQAVREELIRIGVSADRISTVPYGKDRPADMGHDEAAWAKNRRCEFVVVSQ